MGGESHRTGCARYQVPLVVVVNRQAFVRGVKDLKKSLSREGIGRKSRDDVRTYEREIRGRPTTRPPRHMAVTESVCLAIGKELLSTIPKEKVLTVRPKKGLKKSRCRSRQSQGARIS